MAYPGAVPASAGKRALAYVIDVLAAFLLGGAFLAAGAWQSLRAPAGDGVPRGATTLVLVGGGLLLALGLAQWWYHGTRGATLGKALVGLRTVDADTARPIGMGRALLRALVVAAGTLALGVGQIVVLASPLFDAGGRRRGWHDKAVGALVVDVVAGVDPARVRAGEEAVTTRLDGLLAPVAAVDLPAPPPPPPPPAGEPAPTWPEAGPTAPDFLAPYPAAVPPAPEAAEPLHHAPVDRAVTPDAASATAPGSPVPDGDTDGRDDDRTGVISAVPGVRPVAPAGPPPLEPTVLVDHVPGGLAVPGRPTGTGDLDDLDDVEATRLTLSGRGGGRRRTDGPSNPVLHLWNGEVVALGAFALVGRNPARRDDEPLPDRLVTVPDERRSVSKTHLAVGVDPSGIWVRDRGSTNGTVVTLPDGAQVICAPGQRVRVPVGATVSFGDFWFTIG